MARRFDLNIELSYRLKTDYSKLVKYREWVCGFPVELTLAVTNKSAAAFPKSEIDLQIAEHGQAQSTAPLLSWAITANREIPGIKASESTTIEPFIFVPLVEGLCEVKITVVEPANSEVWVTGWRRSEPWRKEISEFFKAVRWQELEMINLLRNIGKGK